MMIDHLSKKPRVIYVGPDEPAYPLPLVFAAGLLCGVLATGVSILLWALV